ncbi:MAG: hypothetical protein ACM3WV_09195 [Bacillota bacterium]
MTADFIARYWPYWIAGLIVSPLVVILFQLANIRYAIDHQNDGNEVAKRFLSPVPMVITVIFGMTTFVFLVLFAASVIIGIVAGIKALF